MRLWTHPHVGGRSLDRSQCARSRCWRKPDANACRLIRWARRVPIRSALLPVCLACLLATESPAALVTNFAVPVTHTVTVQPIIVSNDDGANTAEYFGSASQQSAIDNLIDSIWAQAGIKIDFLVPNVWNNSFANIGMPGMNDPRPTDDLAAVVTSGDLAGVGNSNPQILDIYFVEISSGFPDTSEFTANGRALIGANGITQHVGDELVNFQPGQEVIASVVAHEIGHNLGLSHLVETENLMESFTSGQRLNAAQISTVLASQFAVPTAVPEPRLVTVLFCLALVGFCWRQRQVVSTGATP